jgi:hypothetical protein
VALNFGLGRRPEVQVADFFDAVLAPELVTLKGVLSVGVNNNGSAIPASEKEHPFHLMELHLLLMLQPNIVPILTNGVANLAKEEIANHGQLA